MAYVGDYTNPTWTNGVTKLNATNMQAITDKVKELDTELDMSRAFNWHWYRDYLYLVNQRIIEYCQTGWTADLGAVSTDSTNYRILTNSIRATNNNAAAAWTIVKKSVTVNCETSISGDTFDSDDFVLCLYYVQDSTAIDIVQFWLIDGVESCYHAFTSGWSNGWNYEYVKISDMTNYAAVDFTAITEVSYRSHYEAGNSGKYTCIQYLGVCRKHPTETDYPELMQIYNGTSYEALNTDFTNYVSAMISDNTGGGFINPNFMSFMSQVDLYALQLDSNYWKNFYFKAYFRLKKAGKTAGVCWYYDSDNYINFYLDGSNVYIDSSVGGSTDSESKALGGTPAIDTTMLMMCSKVNGVVRCIFWFTSLSTHIIEIADPLSTIYAKLYLSYNATDSFGYLRDFVVSNKQVLSLTSGSSVV